MTKLTWNPTPKTTKNAPDYVIEQIRNALLNKELNPGDRLPSELELATLFNVSRGSVRQAMKSLEMLGILSIRPGDGTYINTTPSTKSFNSLTFALLLSRPSVQTMVEARSALERDIFELVLGDDTKVQTLLPLLKENLQRHKALLDSNADPQTLTENDLEFHQILSSNCGNPLLQLVYDYVMDAFQYSIISTTKRQAFHDTIRTIDDHAAIINALENRSFNDAKHIAQITANSWYQLLQETESI